MLNKTDFEKVLRPVETAESLPPVCYVDEVLFEREMARGFRGGWVSVGRLDNLVVPGDYLALDVGATPLLLLLDSSHQLRAFANTCRHRGMRLLPPGRGRCERIVCPFHAWTYGLDGALLTAPRMDGAVDFCNTDYGLVAVPAASRAGFAFVNVDGAAAPIDTWLGDFEAVHRPWRLDDLITASSREFEVRCNWKIFLEVFNEYYHLQKVHPGTFSVYYASPDPLDKVAGNFSTQFGEHRGVSSTGKVDDGTQPLPPLPGLSGRNLLGTRYSWVYPNLTFAASIDAVWIFEAMPLAPALTRVNMTVCFPQASVEQADFATKLSAYERRMEAGLAEDISVIE
ncbi:MAG: aromatic ring-hydroxylating dioxygenase subunit alpha, partial [Pseudomonadota bacterium]|nr:aromatic ring-hydroxylating dioxygenase subunit alpha [Pseudomonadota bacterium]